MITVDLIEEVLKLMSWGKSITQVAANLRMSTRKFNHLLVSPKESLEMKDALRDAIELGQTLHEAHYEEFYIDAMKGNIENVKEGLIKSYMQNKFKWSEKSEVKSTAGSIEELTDEELSIRRKELLDKANGIK